MQNRSHELLLSIPDPFVKRSREMLVVGAPPSPDYAPIRDFQPKLFLWRDLLSFEDFKDS